MATKKKRIYISLPEGSNELVTMLAKRNGIPPATQAAQLIEESLEYQENLQIAEIIKARKKNPVFISHANAWKNI